ncbi:MAG: 30S ribosomal protein S1 [Gammaproteobacteria bacterium RIFCSPLOWO2_02_FULL_47_50]|nr:MAG: 30S ribosomal protein S1 [Gammaproteobacteria bacterium RIFCSPLOWO2_01_FULL_47_190]OGT75723.1 MAG: 30S ribosomal protein S1 [Gammaproteobacteria bacterium RIFCSPLOWO2_12_47_11]OGT80323.1 MAG: 30S ribosomal protein S1 [Gammaproteobacteria bacterium RIFCSPLOWO2_02_FULL_47_50]OGT85570.1 MAG: 30S ribosomal protein S1 [Gammaproteobacteria bacterium RIFCSPLOWO2_12_FULL_47_76]
MSESFAELFEQSQIESKMRPGTIVSATVVDVNQDTVIVNAGLKSEGLIPIEQFYDEKGDLEVSVGDTIDVALDTVEDGYGETRLSREKAKRLMAWTSLEKAHEANQTVIGVITERVKGGFTVDVQNVRAFLPGSLVDVRPVKDTSYLEGKPLEFKVIKIDQRRSNVVVSRRAVVEKENTVERDELLENLKEGSIIKGVVKNLTDYGAFLDLGGVDGLLHITDMAWKRVKNPAEIVNIGDEIEVKVLKFDRERNRVSLGLKQMGDDPWADLTRRYPEGTKLRGRITNLADYGCFAELEEGVEGLVHVSEMDWTNKNVHPSKLVNIGDEVDVVILDIDTERRRISLGMKQCQPNPWEQFAATHNKGDRVTGTIKSITDFGIFVGLEGGIDGLIHLSDITWADNSEAAIHNFTKGEEIETVVLAVDAERERISLGIKQLEKDPFSSYVAEYSKGSIVKGVAVAVEPKFVTVKLADGVEGQLKSSEISLDKKIEDARTEIKEGDELEVKITALDRKKRIINLSIRAKEVDDEAAAVEEYSPESGTGAKLGDILKGHLENK